MKRRGLLLRHRSLVIDFTRGPQWAFVVSAKLDVAHPADVNLFTSAPWQYAAILAIMIAADPLGLFAFSGVST